MSVVWVLIGLGGTVMVCLWWKKRGIAAEDVFSYSNRLDQIREDDRVSKLIEERASEMAARHAESLITGSPWYYYTGGIVYNVFDEYVARYDGVDIQGVIRDRYLQLIKQDERKD